MRYLVIASCEDVRSGIEFEPGDEFLPEPDHDQAERLVKAGCLRAIDPNAPELPVSARDGQLVAQLREEISSLTSDLNIAKFALDVAHGARDEARQQRDAAETAYGQLREAHDALTAERDERKRQVEEHEDAARRTAPDYERDDLGKLDLKDASKNQLLVIAAYEKADVPKGDKATVADLVKAIEAKRAAA